jgi:hypothetical protein
LQYVEWYRCSERDNGVKVIGFVYHNMNAIVVLRGGEKGETQCPCVSEQWYCARQ